MLVYGCACIALFFILQIIWTKLGIWLQAAIVCVQTVCEFAIFWLSSFAVFLVWKQKPAHTTTIDCCFDPFPDVLNIKKLKMASCTYRNLVVMETATNHGASIKVFSYLDLKRPTVSWTRYVYGHRNGTRAFLKARCYAFGPPGTCNLYVADKYQVTWYQVFNRESGRLLQTPHLVGHVDIEYVPRYGVNALAVSPDEKTMAVGFRTAVRVYANRNNSNRGDGSALLTHTVNVQDIYYGTLTYAPTGELCALHKIHSHAFLMHYTTSTITGRMVARLVVPLMASKNIAFHQMHLFWQKDGSFICGGRTDDKGVPDMCHYSDGVCRRLVCLSDADQARIDMDPQEFNVWYYRFGMAYNESTGQLLCANSHNRVVAFSLRPNLVGLKRWSAVKFWAE